MSCHSILSTSALDCYASPTKATWLPQIHEHRLPRKKGGMLRGPCLMPSSMMICAMLSMHPHCFEAMLPTSRLPALNAALVDVEVSPDYDLGLCLADRLQCVCVWKEGGNKRTLRGSSTASKQARGGSAQLRNMHQSPVNTRCLHSSRRTSQYTQALHLARFLVAIL